MGGDVYLCKGKTIKNVIAGDPLGYDRNFTIKFTDGTELEITAHALSFTKGIEAAMEIKLRNVYRKL